MSTGFKVISTNITTSAATPKQGNWGSATTVASATNLENIKSIRGSLLVNHTGGWTYQAPATLLAVVVDAWISGAWQTVYTTGVEAAPSLAFSNVGFVGAPMVLKAGQVNEVFELPTINLNGQTATGKRFRWLVFGPGSGNFTVAGELHGAPTPQL